jgi:hypothetical protein
VSDELEALRSQVESDPGHPAFPIWVEWLRRQGRLEEAAEAARAGLEDAPGRAEGRAALALVLLDQGDEAAARAVLAEAVGAEALAPRPFEPVPEADVPDVAETFEADEIDQAFEQAEARPEEMMSANDIAERALAQALGASGEVDAASAWSDESEDRSSSDAGGTTDASDRARVIATLEQWLQNLRRTVQ